MKEPQEEDTLEIIAGGTTGLIKRRTDSLFVEKAPYPDSKDAHLSIRDLRREYVAYQRLPQHPRFLRLHSDSTSERLVLPYLQHGCLHEFLRAPPVSLPQRLQFATDATEGLYLLHGAGIVHGDINSWNFLIDDDFRLCIIDFSGSVISEGAVFLAGLFLLFFLDGMAADCEASVTQTNDDEQEYEEDSPAIPQGLSCSALVRWQRASVSQTRRRLHVRFQNRLALGLRCR
jgi:serine/threonine protein kinase